mmetsp:Transcript_2700/g.7932  ORF Transcript_2700/g.7932 Transcript_2700/m.7932 type:complete len:368 (-) Transcript_2700:98-1201(-)|eukprot:CAMPEP_0181048642 /NCGR_PEP_ID=MMETSP1070-20121207/15544_1 /TAXON_ID=265543 /ORGANISM="Minutocellus polymorphus, Strain NH13" /LENGTH=367 /DNA_ID=CAMNT_0023127439 /DNA_START=35 /DNA_END=1138 /DNA_ORIENTATION=-
MGERKVLNKYIPADFDPKLVPRGKKKGTDDLIPVRMMLPFSIQCSSCSSFMYRGRKFNSKKESVKGEKGKYLGIQRFRFYIKCTVCSRPVTFLTDPQNADYEMESGATRNYEVHKDKERTDEEMAAERAAEEKEDPMKALENRVLASQREMQEMDELEEIRALNMKHRQIMSGGAAGGSAGAAAAAAASGGSGGDVSAILDAREAAAARAAAQEEELTETGLSVSEEAMLKTIKFGSGSGSAAAAAGAAASGGTNDEVIHRLDDDDERKLEERRRREEALLEQQQKAVADKAAAAASEAKSRMPLIKVKRKRKEQPSAQEEDAKKSKVDDADEKKKSGEDDSDSDAGPGGGLSGLLGGYGSSSDDSD